MGSFGVEFRVQRSFEVIFPFLTICYFHMDGYCEFSCRLRLIHFFQDCIFFNKMHILGYPKRCNSKKIISKNDFLGKSKFYKRLILAQYILIKGSISLKRDSIILPPIYRANWRSKWVVFGS